MLIYCSTVPRPRQTLYTPHPRSPSPRDQSPLSAADNMDERDIGHLLSHEPDAALRHRVLGHLRPALLAAYDDGK